MKCEFGRELLGMYVDGELESDNIASVEAHVVECKECQSELWMIRQMGQVGQILSTLPRERAPESLINQIFVNAEGNVSHKTWDVIRQTISEVWEITKNGFKIEDERESVLQRTFPEWVARWVLFV